MKRVLDGAAPYLTRKQLPNNVSVAALDLAALAAAALLAQRRRQHVESELSKHGIDPASVLLRTFKVENESVPVSLPEGLVLHWAIAPLINQGGQGGQSGGSNLHVEDRNGELFVLPDNDKSISAFAPLHAKGEKVMHKMQIWAGLSCKRTKPVALLPRELSVQQDYYFPETRSEPHLLHFGVRPLQEMSYEHFATACSDFMPVVCIPLGEGAADAGAAAEFDWETDRPCHSYSNTKPVQCLLDALQQYAQSPSTQPDERYIAYRAYLAVRSHGYTLSDFFGNNRVSWTVAAALDAFTSPESWEAEMYLDYDKRTLSEVLPGRAKGRER
jgi:hypothetical protein